MTGPLRIQRKRKSGWKMPANTVCVTRPGPWGNPFNLKPADNCWNALALGCRGDAKGRQEASVKAYKQWVCNPDGRISEMEFQVVLEGGGKKIPIGPKAEAGAAPSLVDIRKQLGGKNLSCWCALCPKHDALGGKPLNEHCPDCSPCHIDPLGEIANTPLVGDREMSPQVVLSPEPKDQEANA